MNFNYEPTLWQNRKVEKNDNYKRIDNPDGTVSFIKDEGNVIQEGTPVNYKNTNKIEQAISEIYLSIDTLKGDISTQTANLIDLNFELEFVKQNKLVGTDNKLVFFHMQDLNDINLIKGHFDKDNQRITI